MSRVRTTFTLDEHILNPFNARIASIGMSGARFVEGCMKAYAEGKFKMLDGEPYFEGQAHVSRETPAEHRGPGRPPLNKEAKPKSKTHDDKGHLIPWHEQDHSERAIWDYKMYPEPHLASDSRPHLTFDTKGDITGEAFEYTLRHDYLREACKFSEREWQGKLWEYVSCCALKFFTLNKMQNVRYDPDTLFAEVNALYDDMQDDIASCKAYDEEQRNAAK